MDGREGMTLQGSTPYYLHRTVSGSNVRPSGATSAPQQAHGGQLSAPPLGFRPTNPNFSSFNVEGANNNGSPSGFSITVGPTSCSFSESNKKKRGRPRKYGPDGPGTESGSGNMSLGIIPSSPNSSSVERKKRGRPLGSGRKQRLASVGEWMNNSAGTAFMPHVIHIQPGEDIAEKILAFAQQRPRAVCIMSGSGGVSEVSLSQPGSSAGTVTFEGRFEILCLSGSYLIAETGGPRNRTGGVNVSLTSPDGHMIGGAVGGRLVASRSVQVVVCSFVYGSGSVKGKSKGSNEKDEKTSEQPMSDKTSVQMNASNQDVARSWPGPEAVDSKNPNTNIDLASG